MLKKEINKKGMSVTMSRSKFIQIFELIESSKEALAFLFSSSNSDERNAVRTTLEEAACAIFNMLPAGNKNNGFNPEEFRLSLSENTPDKAIAYLGQLEDDLNQIASAYKTLMLLVYELLDALYTGDADVAKDVSLVLNQLIIDTDFLGDYYDFSKALDIVVNNPGATLREYNTLRTQLINILNELLSGFEIRCFSSVDAAILSKSICLRDDVIVKKERKFHREDGENIINIYIVSGQEDANKALNAMDIVISTDDVVQRAAFCFPLDNFDYDRLYLSGKLNCLSENRKNVTIALSGSSYAMVGLKEDMMPSPAVNLAVNAQDPYYTFCSLDNARAACSKIDTFVIVGGYYFWHTDMSDKPSDYYLSVLRRVNYPVFRDYHNYNGESVDTIRHAQSDPLLEKLFDLRRLREKTNNNMSVQLAYMPYFNNEINRRPANGMLGFAFREQSDAINNRAAQARANGHNGNFNTKHLEENIALFYDFMSRASRDGIKVIVLIPPVTRFYRPFVLPELQQTTLDSLRRVKNEFDFMVVDLIDSPDFDEYDFQDYDHLNEQGAQKLSSYVANQILRQWEHRNE